MSELDVTRTDGQVARDGLLLAASRTYAEQYVEPFIRHWFHLKRGPGDCDAIGPDGCRYEIKACKVLRTSTNRRGRDTVFARVGFELTNNVLNRSVLFEDALMAAYDANIQNVKRDHFDELIYVLLFGDCVKIFRIATDKIHAPNVPGWSDRHGRYDAVGKSGQFSINKRNINWHLSNTLVETVGYDQVAVTLKGIPLGEE